MDFDPDPEGPKTYGSDIRIRNTGFCQIFCEGVTLRISLMAAWTAIRGGE
jgi:hypothetical protein